MDNQGIKAVDLFSGCGGMSLGFMRAGFDVVEAFDNWDPAIEVYARNFGHPITKMDLSDVAATVEAVSARSPQLMFGGPPCQDFSCAGLRDESRGRAALTVCYAKVVADVRPRWFVMENVPAIRNSRQFEEVCGIFREAGYGLTCKVLNAAYCGVPQARKRMFVVGGLGEPDGFLEERLESGLSDKPTTVRDCLGGTLGTEFYYVHPRNYSRRAVFSVDEPAPTMRGHNRPIPKGYPGHRNDACHDLSKVRPLTERERGLVQTFPEDFEFFGTKSNLNQMIGNAVPVNLAKYVGTALMEHIIQSEKEDHANG